MLIGIKIKNFRCIQKTGLIPLLPFNVLVGPNGAGKSTVLDAISFVRDCLDDTPVHAMQSRNINNFRDMTFMKKGGDIELTLCFDPSSHFPELSHHCALYRIVLAHNIEWGIYVKDEKISLLEKEKIESYDFESQVPAERGKTEELRSRTWIKRLSKGDMCTFTEDVPDTLKNEDNTLCMASVPPQRLALSGYRETKCEGTIAGFLEEFLLRDIHFLQLDSMRMRSPCHALSGTRYITTGGGNLPRVVGRWLNYETSYKAKWISSDKDARRWISHLQYALPNLKDIGWSCRQADNAEFLILKYTNGFEAPSWILSDGTLKLLGLTLPAFLPSKQAVYLIEEPENGVHPKALEVILRSLSSLPRGQALITTHSPLVVQQSGLESLLCCSMDKQEELRIIPGRKHPSLRDWDQNALDLSTIFAAGILDE